MILQDDFRQLSIELAQIIKKQIDKMRADTENTLKYLEEETERKIKRDIVRYRNQIIQDAEFRLNEKESKSISRINNEIIREKHKYIEDFVEKLKKHIAENKKVKKEEYFGFICKKVEEFSKIIDRKSVLRMNKEDLEYLKEHSCVVSKIQNNLLEIAEDPIETMAGFLIEAEDGTFAIDFRIESILEIKKIKISQLFIDIFPILELQVESAIDIYNRTHNNE